MPIRERMLAMGGPGSGKSFQWLKMAEVLLPTGAKFYVMDTDDAIPYMLETQFQKLMPENKGNVYVKPAFDWPSYSEALEWALTSAKERDWMVCDMVDNAWSSVQRHFVGEVFDKDMGQYFLDIRKKVEEAGKGTKSLMRDAFRGWVDWPVMNKLYDDWMLPIIYRAKCHVFLATKAQPVTPEDDMSVKLAFGELGVRPSGQKNLGHQCHTCFLLTYDGRGSWFITTAKDRGGRKYFDKTRLISLYDQYLVAKAGWTR